MLEWWKKRAWIVVLCQLSWPAAGSGATTAGEDAGTLEFEWRSGDATLEDLSQAQQDATIDALEIWSPWAAANDYRLLLTDDCRALLLMSESSRYTKKQFEQLQAAEEFFVRHLLPAPEAQESQSEAPPADFERTITLIEFKHQTDAVKACERITAMYPRYGSLGHLAERSGFLLPEILIGGWLEDPSGVKYWEADNELINRAVILLQFEQYGMAPLWLRLGTGWFAEFELTDSLYCFPYRDEFVFLVEHSGYENIVRNLFRKDRTALSLEELNDCSATDFNRDCAAMSWGFVTFLGRYYPGALAEILADLDEYHKEHRRGGRFADEGFASTEEQIRIVETHTTPKVWEQAADFFKKGKRYKLPKS